MRDFRPRWLPVAVRVSSSPYGANTKACRTRKVTYKSLKFAQIVHRTKHHRPAACPCSRGNAATAYVIQYKSK
ncbi:hypothetical protein CO2235_170190 [Cupriavidus oxalaticus]|uniref:Uncharacterized protein n=1 Tax=Cupriavidus oxalaticus TaxID=96344 RepID=A0A976BBK4_9BURK|nr:hypothetical protein CO2235_170190 [Cupriavidus oxalaticus]